MNFPLSSNWDICPPFSARPASRNEKMSYCECEEVLPTLERLYFSGVALPGKLFRISFERALILKERHILFPL